MIILKFKQISEYRKQVIYINPKCGHKQEFEYTSPYSCQENSCNEKPLSVDKLIGNKNQDVRVKYFACGAL